IDSNGVNYRGTQQRSSSGKHCVNWINTTRNYDIQNHMDNECKNKKVWYETPTEADTVPTSGGAESFEEPKSVPAQAEGAAGPSVMGVSQRVRTGPKKKKDLGTLGYVLAILMMGIIILLGVGITVGYFYKRGRDLKKQHEQRVYEREMHRITLPLSAFANPTCELVDENTIVISAEPSERTPQDTVEGGDPLMDPAGTPGA
uniref:Phosphoinositide-3-kinase interacting protein 1 n=1 Tax=Astyanax mexicanus TaxID=7994 RepID=A0A8B9J6W4_ASTMX